MAIEWDAERYHRVSDPQLAWGLRVIDRLRPSDGERVLDLGCGTGRLITAMLDRAPGVRVIGSDISGPMLAHSRARGLTVVRADGTALPFRQAFDAVFSTATFHWIQDHPRLFAEIFGALGPGGRLVAQAGGGPNLARLYDRAARLAADDDRAQYFDGWTDPWNFAGVDSTRASLAEAGFIDVHVWLESAPTTFPDGAAYEEFVTTVCLRHHLQRLPGDARARFTGALVAAAAADDPPFTLDYWRLNIDARKP